MLGVFWPGNHGLERAKKPPQRVKSTQQALLCGFFGPIMRPALAK
jgi:hypothetical protein